MGRAIRDCIVFSLPKSHIEVKVTKSNYQKLAQ